MNESLEFHDSIVASVRLSDGVLVIEFDEAIVHRTNGRPGVDAGDVLLQRADLVFREAEADGNISACNGQVSIGTIRLHADALCLVPIPYFYSGSARGEIVFSNGNVLSIVATGFECLVRGEARFLERFPA